MLHKTYFPGIWQHQDGEGYEAVIGWELSSILLAGLTIMNLPINPQAVSEIEDSLARHLFRNRTVFAHAVSQWPPNISLELHLTTIPDLEFQSRGDIHYSLLLRAQHQSQDTAMETALSYFAPMQALLNSCFPEAEFSSIQEPEHLAALLRPFEPGYATLLTRYQRLVNLAQPLTRNPTTFTATKPAGPKESSPKAMAPYTYPWVCGHDSQERLIRFLLWQSHPVWLVIKMRAATDIEIERQRLVHLVENCDAYLSGTIESATLHTQQINLLQGQALRQLAALEEGGLQMAVLIFTLDQSDPALMTMLGNSITAMPLQGNRESMLQGNFASRDLSTEEGLNGAWFPEMDIYTPEEAAAAFRLPTPPYFELPGLPVKRFRSAFAQLPPDLGNTSETLFLGMNVHRGVSQPVHCRVQDRMRHMFILGMTGTGKSSFLEGLILQDIHQGHGLCLVDPHGELVENVIGKIPKEREKDVIILDPLDTHYPVGFNLLEWRTIEERDFIVDDIFLAFDRMYDLRQTGGPIFEHNFRNMLKLLMGDKPRPGFTPTVLEFAPLYMYRDFRRWLLASVNDGQVKDFVKELERTGGDASLQNLSPYITSKFGRFTSDSILKRVVGQEQTPFSFREALDSGKIVLIKLGRGRFGSYVSGFLAAQIVSRFKNAAMSRADIPEQQRRPFFLYVDEFQNLPKEDFTELLAEARKYRLGLIMANQFASQLESRQDLRESPVLRAVLGNVGIFVLFRLGIEDAQTLSMITHPTFTEQDLKELPNWQAYMNLRLEGQVIPPFSLETVLDTTPFDPKKAARIRTLSQKKYGQAAAEVDKQIAARRTYFQEETQPDFDEDQ